MPAALACQAVRGGSRGRCVRRGGPWGGAELRGAAASWPPAAGGRSTAAMGGITTGEPCSPLELRCAALREERSAISLGGVGRKTGSETGRRANRCGVCARSMDAAGLLRPRAERAAGAPLENSSRHQTSSAAMTLVRHETPAETVFSLDVGTGLSLILCRKRTISKR